MVAVLCTRTKAQLDRIDAIFRQRYKRTLKEYIEREMGGNLKTFLSYTQMAEVIDLCCCFSDAMLTYRDDVYDRRNSMR